MIFSPSNHCVNVFLKFELFSHGRARFQKMFLVSDGCYGRMGVSLLSFLIQRLTRIDANDKNKVSHWPMTRTKK